MKKIIIVLAAAGILALIAIRKFTRNDVEPDNMMKIKEEYSKKHTPSVDHSKFAALQQNFTTPQKVTEACISCHNKRQTEIMHSNHWNWEREEYVPGRGIVYLGKKNAINNFCIGTQGNEKSCAKCHIGFGLTKEGLTFTDENNIDCLICHDNTETYAKGSEMGGAPAENLNFREIAASVGRPERSNCGVCHFFGGGGNNVKHGDLESALFDASKEVDIHMGIDGMNMQCVDCHETDKHNISGKMYSLSSMNHNRVTCEQCHTQTPHEAGILNEHTIKVACQTCHIPVYAKVNATKTYWDWSTAGKLKNGEPYEEDNADGNHTYLSIKGSFTWKKNLQPDYTWFNGTASHYLEGDKIADSVKLLEINTLFGSYDDPESKIIPIKIHTAKQPYDPVNKILIQPKLYSDNKGEGAFWKDFNWQTAATEGMKQANLPYSGKLSFIETEMSWPVNHMVSSKENTVKCNECHTRENSRLAALNDFYMPGRDYSEPVEFLGRLLLLFTIIAIAVHSILRIISYRRLKNGGTK